MSAEPPAPRPALRELDLPPGFDSSDNLLESFYVPALSRAARYDRSVGYFRSSALAVAARGLARFLNGGGTVRLLCGAEVTEADRDALLGRSCLDGSFATRLAEGLVSADEVDLRRLEVLAWLARNGRLEVRIALAVDLEGAPLVTGAQNPYFHEKIGVLWDSAGDGIAFQGSVNESATAWCTNFESFSVYASWTGGSGHFSFWVNRFEAHWAGQVPGFRVYPLPEAVAQRLVFLAPENEPKHWDPQEMVGTGDDAIVARFLATAPRLAGGAGLAEATVGVRLYPHQRQVVERLAASFPRSWLVADEVGLGKTISAGMALRRLLLGGEVCRALVLAPANVCRQWQDELFEKFGLWVPRLDGGRTHGAHPTDVSPVGSFANPYAAHQLLIASPHFARRPAQADLIMAAAPYDLVVIDEAHHARRQHANEGRYRPGRLLALLDRITAEGAAEAVWLLSATPMQTAPVELVDLLRGVGLSGALAERETFLRYFAELGKSDDAIAWAWLDRALLATPSLPLGLAEEVVLRGLAARFGPVDAERIARFGTGSQPGAELAAALGPDGRVGLREWLRVISPVGQYVTRHSRETLRAYRGAGLITENLARRDVVAVRITFSEAEQALYDRLDGFIGRLMDAHGSRRGAGFVLTVYRRRLTSSWEAIAVSLRRRLARERLEVDEDLLDDAEDAFEATGDSAGAGGVDDLTALPLNKSELAEIGAYVDEMATVGDSKLDRLQADLDSARSAGHSMIVFSQFTDTLDYLRAALHPRYRSQLATFSGKGAFVYREDEGWVGVAKRDLVEAIRARQVSVLLATDAASEGLNLQACSWLVNYDMPWNPMRVEQRIGRIDRLGQEREVVHVRNYFIDGTVEEAVYAALIERIGSIRALVGGAWQPIVGATERVLSALALRGTHSGPAGVGVAQGIAALMGEIDELTVGGLDLPSEDTLPIPPPVPSPVSLAELRGAIERFGESLDGAGRPATFDPARVSRDPEGWVALATYGHPELDAVLRRHGAGRTLDSSAIIGAGTPPGPAALVRADRSPPEPLIRVAEVDSLGPAVSSGEAELLAEQLVREAVEDRRARRRAVEAVRHTSWEARVRSRFAELVTELLTAGSAVGELAERPGPGAVWIALRDSTDGLQYLEAFRSTLGIEVGTLIGPVRPDEHTSVSAEAWTTIRRDAGARLMEMMKEYRQRAR